MTTSVGSPASRPLQTPKPQAPAATNAAAPKPATPAPGAAKPAAPAPAADAMGKPASSAQAAPGNKPASIISSLKNLKLNLDTKLGAHPLTGKVDGRVGKVGIGGGGGVAAVLGLASGAKGISDIKKSGGEDKLGLASGVLGVGSAALGLTGLGASLVQHFKGDKAAKAGQAAGQAAKAGQVAATAGKVAGKTAGRFIPGVNIGIAALDISNAGVTLANKNASPGAKATSVITAVGSAAAATNIPIISQVGAGISAASSIIGAALGFAGK